MLNKVLCLCIVLSALNTISDAYPSIGKIENCKNHTAYKNGIEISGSWKPFAIKPNTMYTINAEIKIHQTIEEAIESAEVWIPQIKDKPIYKLEEKHVSCKESDVLQALSFVNVTCPLTKGTHKIVTDFQQFLPGTEAVVTGDFIVVAYLKDKKGHELGCWTADVSITN